MSPELEVTTKNGYWTAPLYFADGRTRVGGAPRIEHPYPEEVVFEGRRFRLVPGTGHKGGRLDHYVAVDGGAP